MRPARVLTFLFAATVAVLVPSPAAPAADSLGQVERAFKNAIDRTFPATVVCTAQAPKRADTGSSGVIVSRKGLVLSDGDVGSFAQRDGKQWVRKHADVVDVRVSKASGGFETYEAQVLYRDSSIDSSLLRITNPPRGGFSDYLQAGESDSLRVGAFTFAAGNAFAMSEEAAPTLTAGIVASFQHLPEGAAGGKYAFIYTSAAVNPGVNGGPLVDLEGRLIGTVSTFVPPDATDPYQFLGKVVPIDRLRAHYERRPEARELFPQGIRGVVSGLDAVRKLETVFHVTGREAYPRVVSLAITRTKPVMFQRPMRGQLAAIERYQGAVSGVLADADGTVVTSLYNVTNVAPLLDAWWRAPPDSSVGKGIAQISAVTAHFAGDVTAPYRVTSYHEGLGIAVLTPTKDAPATLQKHAADLLAAAPLPAVPEAEFEPGRFVLSVARPFGDKPNPDPLMAYGILSKRHADGTGQKWATLWQTDASATDGTCGCAAVDIRGRLYGMLTIWDPMRHGRNSGIGFVLPWVRVESVLAAMRAGRTFARPLLGVTWDAANKPDGSFDTSAKPKIKTVAADSAAAKAGVAVGDIIVGIGDHGVAAIEDVSKEMVGRWSGDKLKILVKRGAETLTLDVVLGIRD